MEGAQQPLSQLFGEGRLLHRSVENSPSDSIQQGKVLRAIRCFKEVKSRIGDLVSTNEELDDIASKDLKYLLTDYYLADLHGKLYGEDRVQHLKDSYKSYLEFWSQCEGLKLIPKEELKKMQGGANQSAELQREAKIALFRKEKEIDAKLNEVMRRAEEQKKRANTSTVGNQDDDEDDEEDQRDLTMALLQQAMVKSITEMAMVKKEIQLVVDMEKLKMQHNGKIPEAPKDSTQPSNMPKNYVITNPRDKLMREVFQPKNLPTFTVEEWAEMQMQQGLLPAPGQQAPPQQSAKEEDEEDEEAMDKATYKAREMDDFLAENPKGWGNKADNYFRR